MKIPHRPERYIGCWAASLGHEVFRIVSVGADERGLAYYRGIGLRGQDVQTCVAAVFRAEDQQTLTTMTEAP